MIARRAFGAGVLAAAVESVLMAVSRSVGFPVKLELLLGAWITRTVDARAWIVGFLVHFALGGAVALIYAAGFGRGMRRAGLRLGLAFGAVHALVAGVALLAVPRLHPLVPDYLVAPGPFLANLGTMGVAAFVALHLVYGAIVGEVCKPFETPDARLRAGRPARR